MKIKVKKILAFIISAILLIGTVSLGAVFANKEDSEQNSVDFNSFSDGLVNMISEYTPENAEELTEKSCSVSTNDAVDSNNSGLVGDYTENEFKLKRLIVKAKGQIDDYNAVAKVEGYDNLHVLQYSTEQDAISAYKQLSKIANVEFVEPDVAIEKEEITPELYNVEADDLTEYKSWGAKAMGIDKYNENLERETKKENLAQVVVAVIDTGINPRTDIFNGFYDEEQNPEGRILTTGKDFTEDNDPYLDFFGHGTMVSGVIVDLTLPNVKILPIKVDGMIAINTSLIVYLGIEYAVENGADVINISMGTYGKSLLLEGAINEAKNKNVPVAVAAGNKDINCMVTYPANTGSAITVAACDKMLRVNSWSAYGNKIDFIAPGAQITVPAGENENATVYADADGTSFASPHIAAAIAILKSENHDMAFNEIYSTLKNSSIDLGKSGFDKYYGNGIPCLKNLLLDDTYSLRFTKSKETLSNSFKLAITCENPNARIFYTIDGTVPNSTKDEYTQPIVIDRSCEIRAIATNMECDEYGREHQEEFYIKGTEPIFLFEIDDEGTITNVYGVLPAEVTIPSEIDDKEVKALGEMLFSNTAIESIILPDAVKVIKDFAFYGCSSLSEFNAPNITFLGDGAFFSCESLESIKFAKVPEIKVGTFARCSTLKEVEIPQATVIGSKAFHSCISLKEINFPNVQEINQEAFFMCSKLEKAEFPQVREIMNNAFEMCLLLKEIKIPSVEILGFSVFSWCFLIENIDLSGAKVIYSDAFYNCFLLKDVDISSVEEMYGYAFDNCRMLTSIKLPMTLEDIEDYAVGYVERIFNDGAPKPIKGFTVYGEPNSKAEKYADENGFIFVDINSDYEERKTTAFEKIKTGFLEVLVTLFAKTFEKILSKVM